VVIDATNGNDDLCGVVAIGASAGGVEALSRLAAGLSADVPYAYLMVLHIPAGAPSILARIVDRSGPLPAVTARDGATLRPGHIYVGTPDHHLLVADHRVVLSQGPTENGHRPAINALFRSVAVAFGPRAIGVLLSGVLDDGVLGLAAIRSRGGVTIGQSPQDALFPALPTNARHAGVLDRLAAADEIGGVLKGLSHRQLEELDMDRDAALEFENRIAMTSGFSTEFDTQQLGALSGYNLPGLQRVAHCAGRRPLPLPRRPCLDRRRLARRPRRRRRGRLVGRPAQPAGEGQIGPATGRQNRSRPALSALQRRGRGKRAGADRAQRPGGGQRTSSR
jgi:two-component system, chemotaxis family, protein-glutamate methylesterase/glutaminase